MRKALSALFIIVSFAIILSSFHYHSDGLIHDDCPTCVTSSNRHSIIADSSPSITKSESFIEIIGQTSLISLKQVISNLTARSPPL
jgi:hypothetical protein